MKPELQSLLPKTRKAAFTRGLLKGLAAPLAVFSSSEFPAEAAVPDFKPLQRKVAPSASDWVRVGDALRAAAKKSRDSVA
jgi:hypothetical protein